MRQRAVIIKKEQEKVWVKVDNPSEACGNCNGCIRLTAKKKSEDTVFQLTDSKDMYQEGDQVIIESESRDLLKAVGVLYGVPFVSLFLGYAVTHYLVGVDAYAGLGAVGGLLAGALVARPIARRIADQVKEPQILSRACA